MNNIDTIYLFLFILSVLTVIRTVFRIISSLLDKEPQRLYFSSRELLLIGISISYILTFLIKH